MKTRIVAIGNSHGIRIPKLLLEQTGLMDEVDIHAQDDSLVIRPLKSPRNGWAEAFQRMAASQDDSLLDSDTVRSAWDEDEWEW